MNKTIILASNSPRRKELLKLTGLDFSIESANVDESSTESNPSKLVEHLSYIKAKAVIDLHNDNCIIIGSDTVVAINDKILGKPEDEADAFQMIQLLQGKSHFVYTGVTLLGTNFRNKFYEKTEVFVYPMSDEEILNYISTGEPMDKAGAYGIQGYFSVYIKGICGDYNNVVGLPVARVYHELRKIL